MNIAQYIDHTLLKPEATREEIVKICAEAKEYQFASVCVNPYYTSLVANELLGSNIKICVVIGFPLGATTQEVKSFESQNALDNGAQEIDMVMNVGALKGQYYGIVRQDIESVVNIIKGKGLLKVILECCLLDKHEINKACEISMAAGADFVKTSTGFSTGGATIEDVKLMRSIVGEKCGVKASGGIRDYNTALAMINAGASRIGSSSGVKIVKESTN